MIERIGSAEMRLQDCMRYMRGLPDKTFDLAIVDPPYFSEYGKMIFPGAEISTTGVYRHRFESKFWMVPDAEYFSELRRVSVHQIIFGINYYEKFAECSGRIIWDKVNDSSSFSKAEIASCSMHESVQIFRYMWNGMLQGNMKNKETRIHPTQKPIKLYEWLLTNYAKPGQRILDTHLGSMSSIIACLNMGFEIVGCELQEEYFTAGVERVKNSQMQQKIFV